MLVVFFVFFLLASGDLFKRKLVKLVGPSLEKKKITVQILDDINTQIARFLLVRAITSIAVGVATWVAFRMIGLEQAGVWAILAGVFNSIPYFGPVIVAAGTAVVAFLQFGTIPMTLYTSGISLVITSVEGWLLTPWLTSRTARTNEIAVFVGLIFWTFVWGVWGTLLAVPMLVAMKACCDRIEDLKPVGELLGHDLARLRLGPAGIEPVSALLASEFAARTRQSDDSSQDSRRQLDASGTCPGPSGRGPRAAASTSPPPSPGAHARYRAGTRRS